MRAAAAATADDRSPGLSAFWSRIFIALALLPVVLGLVWLGGWWIVALAGVAGAIALHEYFGMIRELRPPALAGFAGFGLSLLGVQLGGIAWMLGGFLATVALAFLLWQLAYAELVFVDRLWPDFGEADLRSALEDYARRRRRFGGR